jgi:hypothetical protein
LLIKKIQVEKTQKTVKTKKFKKIKNLVKSSKVWYVVSKVSSQRLKIEKLYKFSVSK